MLVGALLYSGGVRFDQWNFSGIPYFLRCNA
jgi:hypothetical protein